MPRIPDLNDKFIYTRTDPNSIIAAPKGALFFRRNTQFYLNLSGNFASKWSLLPYKTVIILVLDEDKPIRYEHSCEVWIKSSNGLKDELGYLLPKTDWKLFSYDDIFVASGQKNLHWIMPPPASSTDPRGSDNSRSYDENFFYAKISGSWARTPIHLYDTASLDVGEVPYWYSNLPFVDAPRRAPAPNRHDSNIPGDQSYDRDFFYINPSMWKRTPLDYFDASKMTNF